MNDQNNEDQNQNDDHRQEDELNALLAARRKKLENIRKMGIDPWGQRFDDRMWIGDIRDRSGEICFQINCNIRRSTPRSRSLPVLTVCCRSSRVLDGNRLYGLQPIGEYYN